MLGSVRNTENALTSWVSRLPPDRLRFCGQLGLSAKKSSEMSIHADAYAARFCESLSFR